MIDAAIQVRLVFAEGMAGAMGYLDRMGFFEHLLPSAIVEPVRPMVSASRVHRGCNGGLVEFRDLWAAVPQQRG